MVKFQQWHEEHEAAIVRRGEENKKNLRARRPQPVIRKVEEAAPAAGEAPAETSDSAE
jgi:small subunit ribosomal protein S16